MSHFYRADAVYSSVINNTNKGWSPNASLNIADILLLFIVLNRMNLSPVSFLAGGLYDLVSKPFTLMFSSLLKTMA